MILHVINIGKKGDIPYTELHLRVIQLTKHREGKKVWVFSLVEFPLVESQPCNGTAHRMSLIYFGGPQKKERGQIKSVPF